MTVLPLLLVRAQKQLEAFCRRRNAHSGTAEGMLFCLQEGRHTLLLMRRCSPLQHNGGAPAKVLLRLVLDGRQWKLFWPRADGAWEAYAQLPVATDIQDIIAELEQAPLHVHW
jgi:hypothetical protein